MSFNGYVFKTNLYPGDINYRHAFDIFSYFTNEMQTQEFFRYFVFRLESEMSRRKNSDVFVFNHIKFNESSNTKKKTVDINYNFFVEVLGEWVEHYCSHANDVHEYKKYAWVEVAGSEKKKRMFRDFKIDFSIKERVQFDFVFSGWRKSYTFARYARSYLVKILFMEILGYTVVRNPCFSSRAIINTHFLLKDIKFDTYVYFIGVSFDWGKLSKLLTDHQRKKFHSFNKEYEQIITTSQAVKKRIEKLGLDEENITRYDGIDIDLIEINRDISNNFWYDAPPIKKKKKDLDNDENDDDYEEFDS